MPAIVRANADSHAGHAGPRVPFHKTYYTGGSENVFINGESVILKGNTCLCGDPAVGTSPSVFVNGIAVHRIGDSTGGHGVWVPNHAATGSPNVFANGDGPGLVVSGGNSVYAGPAGGASFVTNGGTPNTGVTTRVPLNPAPGEAYTVTITGVPDGPVTYTNPETGQVETAVAVNGVISVNLTAPTAVIGQDSEQAINFGFSDGSVNGGSLIVVPNAVTTAAQRFQQENPTTWRETFREEYFKSIGGDPGDFLIITDPGDFKPGQFWYDYVLENLLDTSTST